MVPEKNGELTENDLKSECVKDDALDEVSGGDDMYLTMKEGDGPSGSHDSDTVFLADPQKAGGKGLVFIKEDGKDTAVWGEANPLSQSK